MMRHTLSRIDATTRTALCARCGPTTVNRRSMSGQHRNIAWRCRFAYSRAADPDGRKGSANARLTPAEFEALRAAQNGRCAICDSTKPLAIDHDKRTGKVRGLLCNACNWLFVGRLENPNNRVSKAARYLIRHGSL